MNLQAVITGTVLSASILISGCANKDMVDSHSGFLKSYEGLEEMKNLDDTISSTTPGADFSNYENIMVAPIEIMSGIVESEKTPEQKKLFQDISTYLTDGYKKQISRNGNYKLAETEGPNTMKLEAAISAVQVNFDDLNWYQYIPISLALTGISRATYSDESVRILAEARMVDTQTNEVLLRRVSLEEGLEIPDDEAPLEFKDVKPALDAWLNRANKQLTLLHSGKEASDE